MKIITNGYKLDQLKKDLQWFLDNSCVGIDITKEWIISEDEKEAVEKIIDVLRDCQMLQYKTSK